MVSGMAKASLPRPQLVEHKVAWVDDEVRVKVGAEAIVIPVLPLRSRDYPPFEEH